MNKVPSDVIRYLATYLTDFEILQFSNTAKSDWEFNRDKHQKNIIYKKIMPILTFGPDNAWWCEERTDFEDIKEEFDGRYIVAWGVHYDHTNVLKKDLCFYIHELSSALLNVWHYPIGMPHVIRAERGYQHYPHYWAKSFASSNKFNVTPTIYYNQKICMIYRCLLIGGERRRIKRSLTLRALVG